MTAAMSKKKKPAPVQTDAGMVAVVHPAGGTWRVIVAAARNGRPTLVEATELPGSAGAPPGLGALLEQHKVARVIGVLPAAGVVCRTCALPNADDEQLEQALALQVEAHLAGVAPEHRMGTAVLPGAPGEPSRSGLMMTWPETVPAPLSSAAFAGRTVTFAPDAAGIAALLDGLRPPNPLLWLDRQHGSVAVTLTHTNGAVFRATREEPAAPDWAQRISRAVAETALSVGHTGAFAESIVTSHETVLADVAPGASALILPPEIVPAAAPRIEGAPSEAGWWSRFGIAAGVLLAATSELASLTVMRDAPEVERPSRIQSIATALARPRTATMTAIACVVLLALAPAAVSGLRLAVLNLRHPDIVEQTRAVERTTEQLAMYQALEDQAFSVTKVLADIVSNTPRGIQLDMIRVQLADRSFAVSGEAVPIDGRSATEVVALMQDQLRDSRLFSEIRLNWGEPNNFKHYEFEVSARIDSPHWRSPYDVERDFARWTLGQRERGLPPPEEGAEGGDETAMLASATTGTGPETGVETDPEAPAETDPNGGGDDRPRTRVAERLPPTTRAPAGSGRPGGSAVKTLAPGEDASDAARVATADDPEADDRDPGTRRRATVGGGADDRTSRRGSAADRTAASGIDPSMIPEPLTEEQIKAMTIEEVSAQLIVVAKAKNKIRRDDDPELFDRLKREFDLLMARRREGS
jgi:hypothetical protein